MGNARAATTIVLLAGLALTGCADEDEASSSAPLPAKAAESADLATDHAQGAPLPALEPSEPDDHGSGCVLTPEQVQSVLAEWVPPGGVEIVPELSESYGGCTYRVTDGDFPQSNGQGITLRNDQIGISVTAHRERYIDNQIISRGIYNTTRYFGGSSASEVYESFYIAARDVGAAGGQEELPQKYPDVGNGLVVEADGISFLLAGEEHWYQGGLGGMAGDPLYSDAMVELANLIAENE